jgi:hypothetical protein
MPRIQVPVSPTRSPIRRTRQRRERELGAEIFGQRPARERGAAVDQHRAAAADPGAARRNRTAATASSFCAISPQGR